MTPLLSSLVGDATTVTVIGLCKNAGKTTAMCRLIAEWEGKTIALTSVGRDGERTDVVTGTEKPEIWVRAGTLFATARGMLPLCDTTLAVEAATNVMTPMGAVAVFRALSDGYIQLAGPSIVTQLAPLAQTFRALGAERVIIDGAAGRKSLAGADENACAILCAGASVDGGIAAIVSEAAFVCGLFATPLAEKSALRAALEAATARFALFDMNGNELAIEMEENGQPAWGLLPHEDCVLFIAGGVTGPMLRTLGRRGAPIVVATPDATHLLMEQSAAEAFARGGGRLLVRQKLHIAAVTANPWSAYGKHVDGTALLVALQEAVDVPVLNVRT